MESKQTDINEIYRRLILIEKALKSRGITISEDNYDVDDEGELTDEIREKLEKRRKSKNYISHEEVKRLILAKK